MLTLRITLCDDEGSQLALISSYVSEYIKREKLDIQIKKFLDPRELLHYEGQHGGSAIYPKAPIIFFTTAPEFSLDAFSVHAFAYLLKPLDKAKLFSELDKCFTYCLPVKKEEPFITIKTAEGLISLRPEQINAVEYFDHRLVYHLHDNRKIETVSSRDRFDKQAADIAALETFIKCASSYFVNMRNILSISHQCFEMKNGAKFPITRKYAATKDIFLKYKFREGD